MFGGCSFGNYLSKAKREHINTGGTWNQLLERVGADCVKSVMRGLGPGRQSAPYPLEQVVVLRLHEQPMVEQGPVNPRALAVLGAWFLTREIELSLALYMNVTVVTNGGGAGSKVSESLVACARVVRRRSVQRM